MPNELIQKLRDCYEGEGKEIAMELARSGDEENFNELKLMASGGRRSYFRYYRLADQLIGIEALGETANEDALRYLQEINTPKVNISVATVDNGPSGTTTTYHEYHHYPNAGRELRSNLFFLVVQDESLYASAPNEEQIEWALSRKAHKILNSTIEKLIDTLVKKNPQEQKSQ
jgi:hypothetical protein